MSNHPHAEADLHSTTQTAVPGEVFIGTLAGIGPDGRPLVTVAASIQPLAALSTLAITHRHLGRQVAVMFAHGQADQPVILGVIHSPLLELLVGAPDTKTTDAGIDGRRVLLKGQEEIVLRCGEASITLRKDGKIVLKGKYLLSDSAGVHRLVGGSVQVN